MSSEENFDTHDSDCPHPRGRPEYGVEARCLIYPPDTRVRVQFNGSSYEAIIVSAFAWLFWNVAESRAKVTENGIRTTSEIPPWLSLCGILDLTLPLQNVEPNGYVVRDNNGNYHHVQHGEILQAIP
ncbi:hypothetical protein RhiXN_02949 [Rhizoctonia solani]|uniref:Uncharacterized protein n=1 Tax=Rhizoctonia solani TaxID=456999 RepID=A0A8H8NR73_9AGAM|nr:uncharacterized protein RhiXN_02949 [Rhizoctonia solani]QRW18025.1 hypothetical protein RhiXN_02949 [Rhizoctonia solani]